MSQQSTMTTSSMYFKLLGLELFIEPSDYDHGISFGHHSDGPGEHHLMVLGWHVVISF